MEILRIKLEIAAKMCFPHADNPDKAFRRGFLDFAKRIGTNITPAAFSHWESGRTKSLGSENASTLGHFIEQYTNIEDPDHLFAQPLRVFCDTLEVPKAIRSYYGIILETEHNENWLFELQKTHQNEIKRRLSGTFLSYRRHSFRQSTLITEPIEFNVAENGGLIGKIYSDRVHDLSVRFNTENIFIEVDKKRNNFEYMVVRLNPNFDYMVGIRLAVTDSSEKFPAACRFILRRTNAKQQKALARDIGFHHISQQDEQIRMASEEEKKGKTWTPDLFDPVFLGRVFAAVDNGKPHVGSKDTIWMMSEHYALEEIFS